MTNNNNQDKDVEKKSHKKNMSQKQKTFLFGATVAFTVALNVGISVLQIIRARKK